MLGIANPKALAHVESFHKECIQIEHSDVSNRSKIATILIVAKKKLSGPLYNIGKV